jgi:hypothetical protein
MVPSRIQSVRRAIANLACAKRSGLKLYKLRFCCSEGKSGRRLSCPPNSTPLIHGNSFHKLSPKLEKENGKKLEEAHSLQKDVKLD